MQQARVDAGEKPQLSDCRLMRMRGADPNHNLQLARAEHLSLFRLWPELQAACIILLTPYISAINPTTILRR